MTDSPARRGLSKHREDDSGKAFTRLLFADVLDFLPYLKRQNAGVLHQAAGYCAFQQNRRRSFGWQGRIVADDQAPLSTRIPGRESPSVSDWVCSLKGGDADAAQHLWDRYFKKLIAHAGKRIQAHNCPEGTVVAEDVAASVFESLWKGANAGRFEKVTDRDELWWLLQAMTKRKVVSHIRHATAQVRNPGQTPVTLSHPEPGNTYQELMSDEPNGDYIIMMQDQFSQLLSLLRDDKLRRIAVLKLEGCSNDDICKELSISSATITRKLRLIRETWQQAVVDEDSNHGQT